MTDDATSTDATTGPTGEQAADGGDELSGVDRVRRYAIEAGLGVALAALVLWAFTAAGGDVTFVYQGL